MAVEDIPAESWVLELEDLEKDTARLIQRLKKGERDIKGVRHRFEKGNILYSKLRTYLNKVLVADNQGFCTTEIIPFSLFSGISEFYINLVLRSKYFVDYTIQCGFGVKMPRLSTSDAHSGQIPLPPLNEQKRIVDKVELLLSIADSIEQEKFDLLKSASKLKNHILELAISGKLVPQDPNDEPAIELLKRVNPNAVVSTDTSHYNGQNLPNGWIQCKFSDLFNVRSARRVHKADWRSEGIPFYRAREIGKLSDLGTVDNDLYIDNLLYSEFAKSGVPQSGDIMITAVGTLGKTYIVRKGDKFYYKDGSVLCIENRNGIDPRYIEMFISSSHFKEQYIWESQGTTVATLTMDRINSYSFVLPPLNEQKRIVSKVDELFAVIDQIKQSLE